jgi:hypothetical protein
MTEPTKYADGLKAAIDIVESRIAVARCLTGELCKPNPAFIAGFDEALICLRAAHSRASRGEDYRSLSIPMDSKLDEKSRIKVQLYPNPKTTGIDCLEDECVYKNECAQHCSAGDFRSEGGITPKLVHQGEEFWCLTKTTPQSEEYGQYGPYSENNENLGSVHLDKDGCVKLSYNR